MTAVLIPMRLVGGGVTLYDCCLDTNEVSVLIVHNSIHLMYYTVVT